MSVDCAKWAEYLLDAVDRRRAVAAITKTVGDLSNDDAYAIQDELIRIRLDRGERIIGAKLGLTSRAKQKQMGVEEPVYGWLTDAMLLPAEVGVPLGELIHPRTEPELVFYMGDDLAGPGVGAADVLAATAAVSGGLEVIDSRFEKFSFTLPDVIADNTSGARFVVGGTRKPPGELDLPLLGCLFEVNGELVDTAAGAALMGSPAESVALLANHLGRRGGKIEKGWTILAGGLTSAVPLEPGTHVTASYAHLGSVSLVARA